MVKIMSHEQDECAICLCPFSNDIGVLDCKHSFCYSCISQWSKSENSCCLCKKKFSSIRHEKNMKDLEKYSMYAKLGIIELIS